VISGRVVNLGGYQLEISQRASLNGGKIYNGILKLRGALATFDGLHTECQIDCIVGQLQFNGGVFDGEGSFEQNGTTNGYGSGGCVFNAPTIIKKSTSAILRLGESLPDTFNSRVEFICVNKIPLEISYGSASVFNDLVSLSCYGANSEIIIGNDTDSVQFSGDAALGIGSEGLNDGTLLLKRISQSSRIDNELTGAEGLVINIESCTFNAGMILTAPSILLKNSVFWGDVALTKTQAASNNFSYGGNSFYGTVTLINQDGTNAFRFANNIGDHFYNDVTFATGSRRIQMAYAGNSKFEGNVSINSNDVKFNSGSGKVVLSGEKNQTLEGTSQFLLCKLEVDKSGGTVQLNQQLTIDSSITFVNGIINTDSTITLKAVVSCSGASNLSFVDGPVKKIGNTAFVFPVGDEGLFYPAGISPPGTATDAFLCKYINQHSNLSENSDSTITSLSQCQYWKIERVSGSATIFITLNWDSLGCGVLDTAGLIIANWSGNEWKDLGRSSIIGNAFIGSITNQRTVAEFSYFTLASVTGLVTLTPTLDNPKTRIMPEDFFGYNGNNTIKSDADGVNLQSWEMIRDHDDNANGITLKKYLRDKYVTLMRLPAGTFSNYSDWRTGFPIYEKDLPNGWKYRQNNYRLPMNRTGNEFQFISNNLSKIAARPIIAFNLLSSEFYYELASLYRMNEVNLPVKYIELGNEFYLSNDQYYEVFPSVDSYMDKAIEWAEDIKQIAAFENTKVAVVGATASEGSSGRQRLWLDQVLSRLIGVNSVDAITLHNYIRINTNGNSCVGSLANADLESFLLKAFDNAYELQRNEIAKIRIHNIKDSFDKEIWFTEFNLDDDLDIRTGTWAHGLFNTIMALKYIESREVIKVISHTMLAGAKYGNIFENNDAFRFIQCHGLPSIANPNQAGGIPTLPIEKSALGTALDAVAYITRGSVSATPIQFNGANKLALSDYNELYGWKFEDEYGNRNSIIVNTGTAGYYLNLSNIYSTVNASLFNAKRISAFNNSYVITQDAVNTIPQPSSKQYLYVTDNPWKIVGATHLLYVPAYSIVVLKPFNANATVTARLSDDVICEGTNAILTIESTNSFTPTATNATLMQIEHINDRYIYSVNPTTTGTITITPCSSCSTLQLEVYPKISDFTITGTTNYCPGDASIELEANFTAGAGGSNSLPYSYLWAPDSGLVSSTCNNTSMCKKILVEPKRTTTYTVYVTDGQCWASQSTTVHVPVNEFDLGSDIQFCSGTTNSITLKSTYIDPNTSTTPTYQWSEGTPSGTSTTFSPSTNISVTLTITEGLCSISDVIEVKMINCCTGAAGDAVAEPSIHNFPNSISNAYYIRTEEFAAACSTAGYSIKYFDKDGILTTNSSKRASVEIDGALVSSNTIYINGELRIQDDYYDDPSNTTNLDIDGLGLILKNCNIKFAENACIQIEYGQLKLENCTLQACSTFMWKYIYASGLGPKDHLPVEITNCIIKDAVQSFEFKNDVPFSFTGNNFENNYSDVKLTNYFKTIPEDVFINNEFKATALFTPYSGQQKFAAIQLINVKSITIGEDVSSSENEFSNSLYGLKAENTSFKLLNNTFKAIGDFTNLTTPGACVYATSEFDYSDREITIGNGTNAGENIFESSTNGVIVDGEAHFFAKNNVFGNLTTYSDKIRDYCIKAENIGKMNLEISSINSFYDYKYGIWLSNSKAYKSFLINNNDFYNFDAGISSASNYEGTAITVLQPVITVVPGAEISGNKIGRFNTATQTQTQPRNGIVVSLMKNIRVDENIIKYKIATANPVFNQHGIWLQQCDYARLIDNEITNTATAFPSQIGTALTGMEMNDCNNTCIELSKINKMGIGMRFTGNSNVQSLYENEINNYDTAYFVDNAFIGTSVGRGSPPIVMNNKWTRTGSSLTTGRVDGSVQGGVIDWYYQFSTNGEYIPTGQIVSATLLSTYTSQNLCPTSTIYIDFDDPPYTSNLRNANYGPVVGDTARYPIEYESNLRALNRSALYLTLKRNPELLRMDDPADDTFVEFYNNMSGQNVQLFDSVMTLIQEEKYDDAEVLNESIEDTSAIDEKLKVSLRMYLKTMQQDSILSGADSAQLLEIAYLNPLYFGTGVYIARNLLNLEIYDDNSGSYRLMSTKVEKRPFSAIIQPNPGRDYISIICSDGDTPDRIRIQSIEGKVLDLPIANSKVNISQLQPGMYLCSVTKSGRTVLKKFIKL
jgi:hypothetical protein